MRGSRCQRNCWLIACFISLVVGVPVSAARADETSTRPIKVLGARRLPEQDIAAMRTPLGIPNDYKPWLTRLDGDKLLMVAFSFGGVPSNELPQGEPYLERAVFWRSADGGNTWGTREEHLDVHGREFALNRLSDGTLLMPCHFLDNDAANKAGHTHSKLFRSTDDGKTWSETRIGPEGFPDKAQTATDWTVFETPDPDAPGKTITLFGVSMQHGGNQAPSTVALWRSRDSGATWDKSLNPDTAGWIDVDGFFSQSTTYRAKSGKLLHVVRVDATGPHWRVPDLRSAGKEAGDQADRMMLWTSTDNGASWRRHGQYGTFGAGGEMYPRFLRLADGRLLLTFTVRSSSTDGHALGLRAIVSHDDGETWDFQTDRLVIDDQNVGPSGGGFGNTIQNADGSLVSCYSYRGRDNKTHIEAVRWTLPATPTGLVGDYDFSPAAPLANRVAGGLPDIVLNHFDAKHPPLLTGQQIPVGASAAPGDGTALAWTLQVPQVGYDRWELAGVRIPADPGLALGDRFTLWIRVLYGGAPVRKGGGYTLLTLDGPDGKPVLDWSTTAANQLALRVRDQDASSDSLTLRGSRWYDLAVSVNGAKVTFFATELGGDGAGATQSQQRTLADGPKPIDGAGALWILRNTNGAVERLRVYRGEALWLDQVRAMSQGVRVPGPQPFAGPVEVGTVRQLFVDDALIESKTGSVVRRFHSAIKHPGNPIITQTHPPEIEGQGPTFWGSVLYDAEEKRFKMWYLGLTFRQPQIVENLYAESDDGLHWTKPVLNIKGPDNRYDLPGYRGGHGGMWLTAWKDTQEQDSAKRYKGFAQHDPLYFVTSPDGLHWTDRGIAAPYTDDTTTAAFHPLKRQFVKIGRFCPDGPSLALRLMMTCVGPTPLAEGNSPWHLVMLPDEKDLAADPSVQFYHMPAFAYGDAYLGLLGIYHAGPKSGQCEMELTFSRDGLNWHRAAHGEPFIPRGPEGSWDDGFGTLPGSAPLAVGEELWFYYSYNDGTHHNLGKSAIGLAKLRRDGFVSMDAAATGGTLRTKPFALAGTGVVINVQAAGSVTVRLLDERGKMLAQSESFTGDTCDHPVTWRDAPPWRNLAGQRVKLEFELRDAALYAFEVTGSR